MKTETPLEAREHTADADDNEQATAERAVLRLDAARQAVQLAKDDLKRVKDDLKRARKRLKEAKREAKRARKRVEAAQKQMKRRGKKRQESAPRPEVIVPAALPSRKPQPRTAAKRRLSRVAARRATRAHRKRAT